MITIATFYHFMPLANPQAMQMPAKQRMVALGLKGTLTLAPEGINATLAGARSALDEMIQWLSTSFNIALSPRYSEFTQMPFQRSKVKVKPELISLGQPANPSLCVGTYIHPKDWNALITRPDMLLIDTRNDYEYRIGHFAGAVNPATEDFKEMVAFTEQVVKPSGKAVAMYCTGGIRCDKYSSYLVSLGIPQVYHLQGGILHYLEQVPVADSLWQGACFVFDERVAVGHGQIPQPQFTMCPACGNPLDEADRTHSDYITDIQCAYCADKAD